MFTPKRLLKELVWGRNVDWLDYYYLMYFPLFVGVLCLLRYVLLCVHSSFAIILKRKRKLVALLLLSYRCIVAINVLWLFLTVPWVILQGVIVVFLDHTYLLLEFYKQCTSTTVIQGPKITMRTTLVQYDISTRYFNYLKMASLVAVHIADDAIVILRIYETILILRNLKNFTRGLWKCITIFCTFLANSIQHLSAQLNGAFWLFYVQRWPVWCHITKRVDRLFLNKSNR